MLKILAHLLESREEQFQEEVIRGTTPTSNTSAEGLPGVPDCQLHKKP